MSQGEERQQRLDLEAKLQDLERRFLRAQRMESIGILAGGIAHDLNNVLLPVVLGCEVLRESLTAQGDREVLAMMEASAMRGTALIKQVLTFARGATSEKLRINPAHLVKDLAEMAARTLPASIQVRTSISKELRSVEADPTQLHQVLLTLVVNARDAMPQGGILILAARNVSASEVSDHFGEPPRGEEYVHLQVSDSGVGIPEALQDRIFEPFFTTKEAGRGTGLGLSTSLGIVRSQGGLIDFTTEPGRGTTFRVYLPASSEGVAPREPDLPSADMSGTAEVVLIIDDEVGPRELMKTILGRQAYQVLTASNGVEAVTTFSRFKDRIHAVLVDYRMPLMDGPHTVRELRKISSSVRIAGMSGHANESTERDFREAGVNDYLAKPFTAEQVLSLLRRLLSDEKSTAAKPA